MVKRFAILFFMAFLHLFMPISAREPVSLTVNIISHSLQNGAGKQVDVSVIKGELEKLGHHVNLFDYSEVDNVTSADINIFLAQFKSKWFTKAKLNWFIPNAEICKVPPQELRDFDLILCKTKESLRIFKGVARGTYYLGFTSLDRHVPSISKDFSKYLHVAGQSTLKGTDKILKAWRKNPELPNVTIIIHSQKNLNIKPPPNVELITKRVPTESLLFMQNECGFHLCPSQTEGFGHYIMEAMSAEAVVITTDAPPMNEFITDKRCLVKYKSHHRFRYATMYIVDDKALANTAKTLQQLPYEELQSIGQHNREEYLRRTEEFKYNFEKLINKTVQDLYGKHVSQF